MFHLLNGVFIVSYHQPCLWFDSPARSMSTTSPKANYYTILDVTPQVTPTTSIVVHALMSTPWHGTTGQH
jgi:hypothetical protein